MIEIRRAKPEDKEAIFQFLEKAYAEKASLKYPERWEWQFENNPFRLGDDLPIWIAVDEMGSVAGQIATMYEPLKLREEKYTLSWAVDIVVLPEYRGKNIGMRLFQANLKENEIVAAISMNEISRYCLTKLATLPLDHISVFKKPVWYDPAAAAAWLNKHIHHGWLGKAVSGLMHFLLLDRLFGVLVNFSIRFRDKKPGGTSYGLVEIKEIVAFDEAADKLWEAISPQFQAAVERSSQYLNWKYVQQPFINYRLFTAERNGQMRGYMVMRISVQNESRIGVIADLLASPGDRDTIHGLLTHAVSYLRGQKVNYIIAASSSTFFQRAYLDFGFKKIREVEPLFHSNIQSPAIRSVQEPETWFFGRSDHDWDQFHLA